jgi:membrane protein involved in colicin uptake
MGRRSKRKKLLLKKHRLLGVELDPQEASRVGLGHLVEEQQAAKAAEQARLEAEAKAKAEEEAKAKAAAELEKKKAAEAAAKKKAPEVKKKIVRKRTVAKKTLKK